MLFLQLNNINVHRCQNWNTPQARSGCGPSDRLPQHPTIDKAKTNKLNKNQTHFKKEKTLCGSKPGPVPMCECWQ